MEWMVKENVVHNHNGILFSLKKNPAIYNNMDESIGHHAKWNKSDTEEQKMHDPTCIRNLK